MAASFTDWGNSIANFWFPTAYPTEIPIDHLFGCALSTSMCRTTSYQALDPPKGARLRRRPAANGGTGTGTARRLQWLLVVGGAPYPTARQALSPCASDEF